MGSQSLTVIGPFMAIMVVGYFVGRLRVLPAESSGVLSQFVFAVALPALIFPGVAKTAVGDFFDWTFIGALGGGMLLVMGASVLTARRLFPDTLTANGLHGLAAMFSSTAYIGLPLVLILSAMCWAGPLFLAHSSRPAYSLPNAPSTASAWR